MNRWMLFASLAVAALLQSTLVAYAQSAAETGGVNRAGTGVTATGGKRTGAARTTGAQGGSRGLSAAMTAFMADTGRLPTTSEGLSILITRPAGMKNWKGPYVSLGPGQITDKPFMDPWGTEYRYKNTTASTTQPSFEIRSAGPDGIYDNADDLVING